MRAAANDQGKFLERSKRFGVKVSYTHAVYTAVILIYALGWMELHLELPSLTSHYAFTQLHVSVPWRHAFAEYIRVSRSLVNSYLSRGLARDLYRSSISWASHCRSRLSLHRSHQQVLPWALGTITIITYVATKRACWKAWICCTPYTRATCTSSRTSTKPSTGASLRSTAE